MKIVIVKVPDGRYRFKVLTGGGKVVTASGTFQHKAAALEGVALFKAELAAANVEEQRRAGSVAHPRPGSLPPI